MNVLILERESECRSILIERLKARGHAVEAVSGVDDAFEALDRGLYSLAFVSSDAAADQTETLFRRIRESNIGQACFCVLLARGETPAGPDALEELGADDCLIEPFDAARAERRIYTAERAAGRMPPAPQRSEPPAGEGKEYLISSSLEDASFLVMAIDIEGRIARFNKAFEKATGFSFEEVHSKPLWALYRDGQDAEAAKELILRMLKGAAAEELEFRFPTKGGETRLIQWRIAARRDGAGTVESLIATGIDITERGEIERALQYSEATARALLNFSMHSAILTDTECKFLDINETAAKIFGKSVQELIGVYGHELLPPALERKRRGYHDQVIRDKKPVRYEDMREGRWHDTTLYPVFDEKGEVFRVALFSMDVTEYKEIENSLSQKSGQLEKLNAELVEARDKALDASRAKSTFLANISHELRTPLNWVIGFTKLAQERTMGQIPQQQTENLRKALDGANQLLRLINGLLDLSKIEAGRMEISPERFDLPALLREAAASVEMLRESGQQELKIDIAGDLPLIHSDPSKVHQIVANLLSNAAKFCPDGRIVLRAGLDGRRPSGGNGGQDRPMVQIEVEDDGIGMSEDELELIFDRFHQADGSATRRYGGTGLGLAISRELAQLLGGRLDAASEPGKGSAFTLRLPVELDVELGAEYAKSPRRSSAEIAPPKTRSAPAGYS